MYTLRHFLFYMGVMCGLGIALGAASGLLRWSSGVSFGVAVAAGAVVCTFAVREGLFGPAKHRGERQHRRHA